MMVFNPSLEIYEGNFLFKQGFYNYKYVIKHDLDIKTKFNNGEIGGNFDETENSYSIVVYYRGFGERYDRVVGFGKASSEYITN